MRRRWLGLLAAFVLVMPAAVGAVDVDIEADVDAWEALEARGSIHIVGDDDFTEENGVRGGSGTAEDPYRIANWTIVPTERFGISIENTRAHVVLQNVTIPEAVGNGVFLSDVGNVSIRDVHIWSAGTKAIEVFDAENLVVERVRLGDPPGPVSEGEELRIVRGEQVRVANVSTGETSWPLIVSGSSDVRVEHSTFRGAGTQPFVNSFGNENLTVANSVIENAIFGVSGDHTGVRLDNNEFVDGPFALSSTLGDYERFTLCGNLFEGQADQSNFSLGEIDSWEFVGNTVRNNTDGLWLRGSNLTIAHNVFENMTGEGSRALETTSDNLTAYRNKFQNNELVALELHGGWADVRYNWWNDPAGPNVSDGEPPSGPGEEEILSVVGAEAEWNPPLEAPAAAGPDAVDCGVPDREAGVLGGPRLPLFAGAGISGGVVVNDKLDPVHAKVKAEVSTEQQVGLITLP